MSGVAGDGQTGVSPRPPSLCEAPSPSGEWDVTAYPAASSALRMSHRRLRRVVADAVGEAAVADGVVGEDDGDAALGARVWRGASTQFFASVDGAADAVRVGGVGGERALGARVPDRLFLVADEQRADAAVELGQHDLHGEVLGGEALADRRAHCACGATALDELDHRRVGAGEGVLLVVEAIEAEGEAGEVEDDAGRVRGEGAPARSGCRRRSFSVETTMRDGVEALALRARR
ncbi:MAG: hypothetical protein V9G20_30120 [Candidatus Promineifilaceae bacterium]